MSVKTLRVPSLVAVALLIGVIVGAQVEAVRDAVGEAFGEQDTSTEAIDVIEDNYFEEVDPEELESMSVRGLVNELKRRHKDRFTHYFDPKTFARFKEVTEGQFSGVGMSVTEVKRGLRVANVFDDSPAGESGIREGDLVTAVDGKSIAGEDSELATAKIKGRPGTEVTLTVVTPGQGSREVELTRRQLKVPAVEGELRRVDGVPVAYVELLGFTSGAHAELRQKVEELYERGAEGLVLDLRGNGGGLLTEAVLTSSVFVEDGPIASTSGRTQEDHTFEATGDALAPRPMVVLINGDTASASEILTAAVADAGLAAVVGQRTFGKGSFQEVIPLDNGGALDLTVGEYLTRDGESIDGTGIPPDVKARDRPATEPDEGLQRALEVLGERIAAGGGAQPQQG
ncbi:MAG: S41 family peptidase [Solirubrobacterales bacterium]